MKKFNTKENYEDESETILTFWGIWMILGIIMFIVNMVNMPSIVKKGGWNAVRWLLFFTLLGPLGLLLMIWVNVNPAYFRGGSVKKLKSYLCNVKINSFNYI